MTAAEVPSTPLPVTNLRPRRVELGLVVMVSIVVVSAYGLASLGRNAELPADIRPFLAGTLGLFFFIHFAVRRLAFAADPVLVPTALLLNGIGSLYWRHLPASEREELAPRLERVIRDGIGRSESSSLKLAYFSDFYSVVTSAEGIGFLERVWNREVSIPGLQLSETDETTMAEQLALRSHPRSSEILDQQLDRIENPDRRERFQFVIPALSEDPDERSAFFVRIGAPANWGREPWVLDGLRFLNHPLRAGESLEQIRPALDKLLEVRDTGDIFFPRNWLAALLSGHNTPRAAEIVREFLARQAPDYPVRLRQIILQSADPLFRAVTNFESRDN